MNNTLLTNLFLGSTTVLSCLLLNIGISRVNANPSQTANKQSSKPSVEYRCIDRNGTPATVAYTVRGPIELIVWKNEYFSGSGYTPENRCREVTSRFQKHSDAKNLRYISTGIFNKHNVICISEDSGQCKSDGLLITLQYDDNPEAVMRDLFNLAARKSGGGITRVGSRNRPLKETIDIDKYLTEKPIANDLTNINNNTSNNSVVTESNTPEASQGGAGENSSSDKSVIENPFENW